MKLVRDGAEEELHWGDVRASFWASSSQPKLLTDVIFHCQDGTVQAHKAILRWVRLKSRALIMWSLVLVSKLVTTCNLCVVHLQDKVLARHFKTDPTETVALCFGYAKTPC
jgi:hypothetical protein